MSDATLRRFQNPIKSIALKVPSSDLEAGKGRKGNQRFRHGQSILLSQYVAS